MEKQRSFATTKQRTRLLTFLCICALLCTVLPSWRPALLLAQDTAFKQSASFIVAENSEFIFEIAGVSPSSVEIIHKDLPTSVSFLSSMKSDTFIMDKEGKREKGTLISYTVHFLEPGEYTLSSLEVVIDSISYLIDFPTVTVSQNPDILLPELYLEAQGSLYQSQQGVLVLSGKYFQRIENLEWHLSENALVEKNISTLPIPSDAFPFSEEKTTIAVFSYTPLTSGILTLPQITATFVAYNGHSYTVQPAVKTVTVFPPTTVLTQLPEEVDSIHLNTSAQDTVSAQSIDATQGANTFLVKKFVALRSQERHSLLPFVAKKERIALEKTANLQNADETSELWTIISVVASVLFLLLGFILSKLQKVKHPTQKSRLPLLCVTITIVLVSLAIFSTFKLSGQHALTLGSQLRTIPEYEASNLATLSAGMRVRILRTGGDWYLVSLEDSRSGWILKDDCILIE